jgi:hypothetical protein
MVPNPGSFCELDPEVKDRWRIPVPRFHWQWTDFELNQVRHQQRFIRELLELGGLTSNRGSVLGRISRSWMESRGSRFARALRIRRKQSW